jgi:dihydroorotase-like cyclic amidohydrolase
MSLVIEGGTIVAADRTYKADVLVEGETIKAIGEVTSPLDLLLNEVKPPT